MPAAHRGPQRSRLAGKLTLAHLAHHQQAKPHLTCCMPALRRGPQRSRQAGKLTLGSAAVTDAKGLPTPTAGALSAAISQGAAYPDPGTNPNPGATDPTSDLPGAAHVEHGASWTGVWVGNGLVKCLNDSALPAPGLCSIQLF